MPDLGPTTCSAGSHAHKCGAARLPLRGQPAVTTTSAWPGRTQQRHLPGVEICLSSWPFVKSVPMVPDSRRPASPRKEAQTISCAGSTPPEGPTWHHTPSAPGQSYKLISPCCDARRLERTGSGKGEIPNTKSSSPLLRCPPAGSPARGRAMPSTAAKRQGGHDKSQPSVAACPGCSAAGQVLPTCQIP